MPALNVDIVFVIDASDSMKPCFDQLRQHLEQVFVPMQGFVQNVRLGLLAHAAGNSRGEAVYDHIFIGGDGPAMMQKLYGQGSAGEDFFTTDPQVFKKALQKVECKGNEEMLVALDTALDFPFDPPHETKRVVAMFTNETLEAGIEEGKHNDKIQAIIQKLMDRRIKLFANMPEADSTFELGEVNESEIETNPGGENAWASVEFSQLLAQMGKSISRSSLQETAEPAYKKALFGQDRFAAEGRIVTADNRHEAMKQGEIAGLKVQANKLGVILDVSPSMSSYISRLRDQIKKNFPNAEYLEVNGCSLSGRAEIGFDDIPAFEQLLNAECDGIFWFCDLQDHRDSNAVDFLKSILLRKNAKFYARSLDEPADKHLLSVIDASGGEFKTGNIQDDLMSY